MSGTRKAKSEGKVLSSRTGTARTKAWRNEISKGKTCITRQHSNMDNTLIHTNTKQARAQRRDINHHHQPSSTTMDKLRRKFSSVSDNSETDNRTKMNTSARSTGSNNSSDNGRGKFSIMKSTRLFETFKSNFRLEQEEVGADKETAKPRFCDQWENDNELNLQGGLTSSRFTDSSDTMGGSGR